VHMFVVHAMIVLGPISISIFVIDDFGTMPVSRYQQHYLL
jgi:hypothetical protein